jgi:hypothetical protein
MDRVKTAVQEQSGNICAQLENQGFFVIDDFLGESTCATMRNEAENLHALGMMVPSQSTKWDPSANGGLGDLVPYDKHNVLSIQVQGGQEQYGIAPLLVEYTVALTKKLASTVATHFPNTAPLDATAQTNKLAVCLGDGSAYDKHIDNQGGGDLRKLTVLYYLNRRDWDVAACGGSFRAFGNPCTGVVDRSRGDELEGSQADLQGCSDDLFSFKDIDPAGDRLFGFWSDKLVHRVLPSFAPAGHRDYRYALTVWLVVRDAAFISHDHEVERLHFDHLSTEPSGFQGLG